jgi:4-hydroxy-tetrahydrodipicolinate reductase
MNLIITGINGRMGKEIAKAALADSNVKIAAIPSRNSELQGVDVGEYLGVGNAGVAIKPLPEIDFSQADCLIDFTLPAALPQWIEICQRHKLPMVTGTTGIEASLQKEITALAGEVPIVQSFNMSIGITLLSAMIEKASAALDESFDIEIQETHHRHKKDAPSGTALLLAESAASARNINLQEAGSTDRNHLRKAGEIGFSVTRGGGVIGDHEVLFMSENEQITLGHRAHNRSIYADGALKAAKWLIDKPAGLYSMRDVLGI